MFALPFALVLISGSLGYLLGKKVLKFVGKPLDILILSLGLLLIVVGLFKL